jgi:hypothetical protein
MPTATEFVAGHFMVVTGWQSNTRSESECPTAAVSARERLPDLRYLHEADDAVVCLELGHVHGQHEERAGLRVHGYHALVVPCDVGASYDDSRPIGVGSDGIESHSRKVHCSTSAVSVRLDPEQCHLLPVLRFRSRPMLRPRIDYKDAQHPRVNSKPTSTNRRTHAPHTLLVAQRKERD